MSFAPYPSRSGLIFIGLAALGAIVTLFIIQTLLPAQAPVDLFKFLLALLVGLALTGTALYWALVAFKLHYHINRNGLTIQWGLSRQLIPIHMIEQIIPGKEISPAPK